MTRFAKALACASAALIIAGTASADSGFNVDFRYAPNASAERTYTGFKQTARKACRDEYRTQRSTSLRHHLVRACQAQLLDRVVERVNDPAILALHRPGDERIQRRLFAQN